MNNYEIKDGKFVINNYQHAKRFCSFLPGIAGEDGKPIWAFYCNVGQCMGGFGIENKNNIMTPFESAVMAYSNIPLKSFRTFILIDESKIVELFNNKKPATLIIGKSSIEIKQTLDDFDISIIYSTIPHKFYGGLIRRVTLTNTKEKHTYKILDGLPIFLPKGVDNYSYHNLTTLVSAYCKVELNENAPFYTYTNRGGDEAKVISKTDGNIFVTIDENNAKMPAIVDSFAIFNDDTTFVTIGKKSFIYPKEQRLSNNIPCAFSLLTKTLKKNDSYSFVSMFSSFDSKEQFNNELKKLTFKQLNNVILDNEKLINSLIPEIKIKNECVQSYIEQSFLDNGIRGGFPILINHQPYYLYSRKHGDMERDYNDFSIPYTFFSSGFGNYRDINQNRRNDLLLCPELNDSNIHKFVSLIETNGFNPLVVNTKLINGNPSTFKEALDEINNLDTNAISASYVEGYWVDHFAYNLDLIENYLSVYPDKLKELMLTKKYVFYDSGISIKPRKDRYVEVDGKIRQYDSLTKITTSNQCLSKGTKPIEVSLLDKLISLIIIKYFSLDKDLMGIDMYANKPGWNDSCNGLPGLLGSSMNETIELLLLVNKVKTIIKELRNSLVNILNSYKPLLEFINNEKKCVKYYDKMCDLREQFELSYRNSPSLISVKLSDVEQLLNNVGNTLENGIKRAKEIGNGIIPTYFIHNVTKYKKNNDGTITIIDMETIPVQRFLEAPARLAKLGNQYFTPDDLKNVLESGLFDKKLKIFKTCESLDNASKELGRVTSFNPGWLERESDFLHMTFKFLLGLLKAGYYKEFFQLAKTNIPCFMNPEVYGRSVFENVSFISPTNHPDKNVHGQGFYARLTGANTEIVNMVNILAFGDGPFITKNKELYFEVKPHIPLSMFKNSKVVYSLFGEIKLEYINKKQRDYDNQSKVEYIIDGKTYSIISGGLAKDIRNKKYKKIQINIL